MTFYFITYVLLIIFVKTVYMLYQLPNGKTVHITIDQYLSMTDDELRDLNCGNFGTEINAPFFQTDSENDDFYEEPLPTEIPLDELTSEEKLEDSDFEEDY